jgi:hypothetical protein
MLAINILSVQIHTGVAYTVLKLPCVRQLLVEIKTAVWHAEYRAVSVSRWTEWCNPGLHCKKYPVIFTVKNRQLGCQEKNVKITGNRNPENGEP